ncbi:MAG: hypothetical protein Q9166_007846 [cf. Caloplaca sp. 2 TL-2023]
MHLLLTVAIASLLILTANAAPQKPTDLTDKTPRSPDKCGPVTQNPPTDPSDTCNSKPQVVPSASAFGILGDVTPDTLDSSFSPNWESCNTTIIQTCRTMAAKNTSAGTWYFTTNVTQAQSQSDSGGACQIGFWLPRDDIGPIKSEYSQPEAAQKPSEMQCQNILNATLDAAMVNTRRWVGASINIVNVPKNQPGEWKTASESEVQDTGKDTDVLSPKTILGRCLY